MALSSISSSLAKLSEIEEVIKQGYRITESAAEDLLDSPEGKIIISDLKGLVLEYAKMERDLDQWRRAIHMTKTDFQNNNEREPLPDLERLFDSKLQELSVESTAGTMENHPEVIRFVQTFCSAIDAGTGASEDLSTESELVMTLSENLTCPLTKTLLVEPVKSSACGHTYSREAIETHVRRMGRRARCPMVGCASIVSLEQLEPDSVMTFRLKKKNR